MKTPHCLPAFKLLASILALAIFCPFPALAAAGRERKQREETGEEKQRTVRVLALKGTFADHPSSPGLDPFSLLLGDFEKPGSFPALCDKIDELARDDSIDHVLFDLSSPNLSLNLAQLAELSRHIDKLGKADKRTFAWIEDAGIIHYSVASACDTVIMADLSVLDLPSLSLTTLHFHNAMELLGVNASVARTGDFKGAVEPFTRSEMSPELRAHYRDMIEAMNDAVVARIATGRKLEAAQVRKLQAERLFTAQAAQEAGLIDQLTAHGTQRQAVEKLLGGEADWVEAAKAQPKQLSFFELFAKLMAGSPSPKAAEPALAVLHLDGQIIDGARELPGFIVGGPVVKAIQELEADGNIRAVVVRINSPGGSATASEAVRSALEQLARKKSVVISMGDMAASGGYWVACIGRPIFAEPGTITGSIGVFALKLSFGPLMKRIGLGIESVTLDESASAMSLNRTWTPAEQERVEDLVENIYEKFLKLVADSRKLNPDELRSLAEGRVWSGKQALDRKLIDHLGGLEEAMELAAKEAGLQEGYPVIHRPREKSLFEELDLFGNSTDEIRAFLTPARVGYLQRAGFKLRVPLTLLREALSGPATKVWALTPTEFVVR